MELPAKVAAYTDKVATDNILRALAIRRHSSRWLENIVSLFKQL